MSLTIAGLLVALLGTLGLVVTQEEAVTIVSAATVVIGIGLAWYRRYSRGDITVVGLKVPPEEQRRP